MALISVIVCSSDPDRGDTQRRNVAETIGVEHEYLLVDNRRENLGICAAYNRALAAARGALFVFVHDDVRFLNFGWGALLAAKFRDPTVGLVGVAGTKYLPRERPFWAAAGPPFLCGQVVHELDGVQSVDLYSRQTADAEVVVADGLFLAIRAELFAQVRFDDVLFDAFDFYDLDICMQVRRSHRLLVTSDVKVKHFSGGRFGEQWEHYARRFVEKHADRLPASCCAEVPDLENRRAWDAYAQVLHGDHARPAAPTPKEEAGARASVSEALALGLQHHKAGRFELAEEIYRRVLQVEPAHAEALHLAGLLAHQQGRPEAAIGYLEQSVRADPGQAAALRNLAEVYRTSGRPAEAIGCCRRAIRLKPDDAAAHHNLGVALYSAGRLTEAAAAFQQALRWEPGYVAAMNALGVIRLNQSELREAAGWFEQVLQRQPEDPSAHNNLAVVFRQEARLDEAAAHLRRALRTKPDYHEARNNLGLVCQGRGDLDGAADCFRQVLRALPDQPFALANLASVRQAQGLLDEAIGCYRRAMAAEPESAPIHSSYLNTLQYSPDVTLAALQAAHAEYQRRHAAPLRAGWRPHANPPQPERRLRVGFVSPNFAKHPVGAFGAWILENLDRRACELICYSDVAAPDEVTDRFRRAADAWNEVSQLSDEALAEKIRTDAIDVLFDLAGHTSGNRLLAIARRPAPIQITWLDYVGTTGLEAIDYLLADRYEVPPEAEPYYAERILRMPDGYVCYEPPADAPAVAPLPAREAGRVTFGSFNNPAKITPAAVALWAEILRRVAGSRLLLKYNGLNTAGARARFHQLFARHGVADGRVELLGGSAPAEHLAAYNEVDIALDTLPYNGGLTTCEALWMGVPVVTCPGETFASRHSLSHLSNAGLAAMIARSREEYVDLAARLAGDLPRLAELRSGLRGQVAGSPLCDGKRFADNLAEALRGVWGEWCRQQ